MQTDPFLVCAIVFACVFGCAIVGMLLSKRLPTHHLSGASKDLMTLGVGLIGTMSVLVLGLLTASAKDFFDTKNKELTEMSAKIVMVDRMLAHYGPETAEVRGMIIQAVMTTLHLLKADQTNPLQLAPSHNRSERVYDEVHRLVPKNNLQASLKEQALNLLVEIAKTRWLMFEEGMGTISKPFLVVMVFWLMIIFVTFGLFFPKTGTVATILFFWSISVSSAIFLILEMYRPFEGIIKVSVNPLNTALMYLGK